MGYIAIYDGLRSGYEARVRAGSDACWSATTVLTFLAVTNLATLLKLADLMTGRKYLAAILGAAHSLQLFGVCGVVFFVHIAFAQRAEIYDRRGPPLSPNWIRQFVAYASSSAAALLLTVAIGWLHSSN